MKKKYIYSNTQQNSQNEERKKMIKKNSERIQFIKFNSETYEIAFAPRDIKKDFFHGKYCYIGNTKINDNLNLENKSVVYKNFSFISLIYKNFPPIEISLNNNIPTAPYGYFIKNYNNQEVRVLLNTDLIKNKKLLCKFENYEEIPQGLLDDRNYISIDPYTNLPKAPYYVTIESDQKKHLFKIQTDHEKVTLSNLNIQNTSSENQYSKTIITKLSNINSKSTDSSKYTQDILNKFNIKYIIKNCFKNFQNKEYLIKLILIDLMEKICDDILDRSIEDASKKEELKKQVSNFLSEKPTLITSIKEIKQMFKGYEINITDDYIFNKDTYTEILYNILKLFKDELNNQSQLNNLLLTEGDIKACINYITNEICIINKNNNNGNYTQDSNEQKLKNFLIESIIAEIKNNKTTADNAPEIKTNIADNASKIKAEHPKSKLGTMLNKLEKKTTSKKHLFIDELKQLLDPNITLENLLNKLEELFDKKDYKNIIKNKKDKIENLKNKILKDEFNYLKLQEIIKEIERSAQEIRQSNQREIDIEASEEIKNKWNKLMSKKQIQEEIDQKSVRNEIEQELDNMDLESAQNQTDIGLISMDLELVQNQTNTWQDSAQKKMLDKRKPINKYSQGQNNQDQNNQDQNNQDQNNSDSFLAFLKRPYQKPHDKNNSKKIKAEKNIFSIEYNSFIDELYERSSTLEKDIYKKFELYCGYPVNQILTYGGTINNCKEKKHQNKSKTKELNCHNKIEEKLLREDLTYEDLKEILKNLHEKVNAPDYFNTNKGFEIINKIAEKLFDIVFRDIIADLDIQNSSNQESLIEEESEANIEITSTEQQETSNENGSKDKLSCESGLVIKDEFLDEDIQNEPLGKDVLNEPSNEY